MKQLPVLNRLYQLVRRDVLIYVGSFTWKWNPRSFLPAALASPPHPWSSLDYSVKRVLQAILHLQSLLNLVQLVLVHASLFEHLLEELDAVRSSLGELLLDVDCEHFGCLCLGCRVNIGASLEQRQRPHDGCSIQSQWPWLHQCCGLSRLSGLQKWQVFTTLVGR